MQDALQKIVIGGLLHDIGKVLFRSSDGRNHSVSGYDFLKNEVGISDPEILDQVRYHHKALLNGSGVPENSLAYITYMADNIAAASDRRKKDDGTAGFDRMLPLDSIFNLLNGNHGSSSYSPGTLDQQEGIHYPTESAEAYTEDFYQKVRDHIKDVLSNLEYSEEYLNSLIEVMEANLSFVPSSTSKDEIADISLFDHEKLTAALGSCIYHYLEEKGETDYKGILFDKEKHFYEKDAFLLYSMDMSGIQAFIYGQYGTDDVLKNLRARSFYLEIMMESLIDDLLDDAGLFRANRIYSGGGHAYLLLPNTEKAREAADQFEVRTRNWFLKHFQTDLFLSCGYEACSANDMKNYPAGSYGELYKRLSTRLSEKKIHRYSAGQVLMLQQMGEGRDGERECRICHRSDKLVEQDLCQICSGLIRLSKGVLNSEFFTILSENNGGEGIAIGENRYLYAEEKPDVIQKMKDNPAFIRTYGKNMMYTGKGLSSRLWVGDYSSASTLEQLVKKGRGISRLGVLRADIDNLGQAFSSGFPDEVASFSRSATFSRKLSMYFKRYINDILENAVYSLDGATGPRSASIIYSGGDDVFIVGAWKDILEFAVDLRKSLGRFSQGTLTISAGFGMFPEKYPISYIAEQTGDLEEYAKDLDGKDGISLFDRDNTYKWDVFIDKVLGEKFRMIYEYFSVSTQRGNSFLYNLLELMKNREERINLARFAYVLARLEPDKKASDLEKEVFSTFSRKMYAWMKDEEDSRQAVTAIYIYAYLVREEEGDQF